MRIFILVFLCFLVLLEAKHNGDDKEQGDGKKKHEGDEKGPHNGGKVEIHGTVLVKLPKKHPKPTHITVMVKPAASNAKADEHEVESGPKECQLHEDKKDKAHTTYSCPYEKLSVEHHGDEKIKVGARLDSEKHLGGKALLHKIKGQGKDKEEAWSLPIAMPANHEVDFNFNLKKEHVHPTIKVKGHISVHIKGHVHLKLANGHKKPKAHTHVMILIKMTPDDHSNKPIKSKDCENDVCQYEGNFVTTKEQEKFKIVAFMDPKHHSKPSGELTVGKDHKIQRDFNLHLPALTIDWDKQVKPKKGKNGGEKEEAEEKPAED
ncbi:hypothetical protein Ddc_20696 [Ditylenchus destructor]|nr:hypothetical protein Ddc_20696 [Ditylenchus destructor]